MIRDLFFQCVWILERIGDVTGIGYELTNIVIFVFINPLLILIFFFLWRYEKKLADNEK
jgi:hypothetical protein